MYPYTSGSLKNCEKNISAAEKGRLLEPESDLRITELIKSAVKAKNSAAEGYKNLMSKISDSSDRETVRSVYLEELRHKKLLEAMLEAKDEKAAPQTDSDNNKSVKDILSEYAVIEIESARFFRDLSVIAENTYPNKAQTMLSIMNDEQNHAMLNIYLFTKYQYENDAALSENTHNTECTEEIPPQDLNEA